MSDVLIDLALGASSVLAAFLLPSRDAAALVTATCGGFLLGLGFTRWLRLRGQP